MSGTLPGTAGRRSNQRDENKSPCSCGRFGFLQALVLNYTIHTAKVAVVSCSYDGCLIIRFTQSQSSDVKAFTHASETDVVWHDSLTERFLVYCVYIYIKYIET